jgi:hypothetical protein
MRTRTTIHEAGHAIVASLRNDLEVVAIDLTPEESHDGDADGLTAVLRGHPDVAVGLAGAAACEACGLGDPAKGAEWDIATVVRQMPLHECKAIAVGPPRALPCRQRASGTWAFVRPGGGRADRRR